MSETPSTTSTVSPGPSPIPNVPETSKPMRQIIIETDGTFIKVVKADVAGSIEFMGILQFLIREISK